MLVTKLLSSTVDTAKKASHFTSQSAISFKQDVIEPVKEEIRQLSNEVVELEEMSLETDNNRAVQAITLDTLKERMARIAKLELEIKVAKVKLKSYKATYNKYYQEA